MKVVIAGSRKVQDMTVVLEAIDQAGYDITEVVSGGAAGVDALGEEYALTRKIPLRRFPVRDFEWESAGPRAGHDRNALMADYGDALIAVWDGSSTETHNMIGQMKKRGKPYFVYRLA